MVLKQINETSNTNRMHAIWFHSSKDLNSPLNIRLVNTTRSQMPLAEDVLYWLFWEAQSQLLIPSKIYINKLKIFLECFQGKPPLGFKLQDGFLFKENRLCIPRTSLRLELILETHAGELVGHFGRNKAIAKLESWFYWPLELKKETEKVIQRCPTCQ